MPGRVLRSSKERLLSGMKGKLFLGALLLGASLVAAPTTETDTVKGLADDPFLIQLDSLLFAEYFLAGPDSTVEDPNVIGAGPEVSDKIGRAHV